MIPLPVRHDRQHTRPLEISSDPDSLRERSDYPRVPDPIRRVGVFALALLVTLSLILLWSVFWP